jgi:hypothetical protein
MYGLPFSATGTRHHLRREAVLRREHITEFEAGEVIRETQYFGEAFEPGPSRAQWVEK